jgi:hypothetical protein
MITIVIYKILEISVIHWPTNTKISCPAGFTKWAVDDEN